MKIQKVEDGVEITGKVKLFKRTRGIEKLFDHGRLYSAVRLGESVQMDSMVGWHTTAVQSLRVFKDRVEFKTLNSVYVIRGFDEH